MDCPQGSPCDHCMDTRGLMLNSVQQGAHRDREDKWTMLPLFKESSAMTGESYYDNVELINFTTNEKTCGARQAAVMPFLQPDYTPFAEMKNIRFTNVAHEAVAFIQDPPQGWANEQDCVEFTCTGMYNIAIYFSQVKTGGDRTPFLPTEFTIVSDNKESTSV